MSGQRSPYDVLGLRPGAGRAEVNDAYRRLMKRHHPDRPGGDSNRAAEINRAYTYLRRRLGEPARMPVPVPAPARRRSGTGLRSILPLFILAAAAVSAAALSLGDGRSFARDAFASIPQFTPSHSDDGNIFEPPLASLDEPVQSKVVAKAIADAVSFHSSGDLAGAADYSDVCQKSLRRQRTLGWFDACAAFDEAMLTLNDGDPDEPGPFNESAVIAREVAAARLFADRSMSFDAHLHDIRSQVDMAVLPMLDPAAAERP